MQPSMYKLEAFDPDVLENTGIDPSDATWAEIPAGSKLYGLVAQHVAKLCNNQFVLEANQAQSRGSGGGCCSDSDEDCDDDSCPSSEDDLYMVGKSAKDHSHRINLLAGLGKHVFEWNSHKLVAVKQTFGLPVGTGCGPAVHTSIVLVAQGNNNAKVLQQFAGEILAASEATHVDCFTVYRWHQEHGYWHRDQSVPARPLTSVVLEEQEKEALLSDITEFLCKDTQQWYTEHGIPYKRSYLFFGAPGAGKTSMIQALAGHFKRNVCYVQACHPKMTDDSFIRCLQTTPRNSILVLEDIDALFDEHRAKKESSSPLTFTGLLNSLDGIGNPSGQIFVLTTNFRDKLDSALIRNGRVDVHVRFSCASDAQIKSIWGQFKGQGDRALAERFCAAVRGTLGGKEVSMAAMQNFFIKVRRMSAEESIENVHLLGLDLNSRQEEEEKSAVDAKKKDEKKAHKAMKKVEKEGDRKARKEAKEVAKKEDRKARREAKTVEKKEGRVKVEKQRGGGGDTHVHINISAQAIRDEAKVEETGERAEPNKENDSESDNDRLESDDEELEE